MQFPKQCKIHKACAKDASRYLVHAALLDIDQPEQPVLVATNGKILAVVNVSDAEGETGTVLIPQEAITEAIRGGSRNQDPRLWTDNGTIKVMAKGGGTTTFPRYDADGKFPEWRAVLPQGKPEYTISLDVGYLADLATALGSGLVKLEFFGDGKPVKVKAIGPDCADTNNYGVIMPVSSK